MKPSVIVWDLETVPDLGGFAAAHDLVGKSDLEVREAIGDKFPKHIYHSNRLHGTAPQDKNERNSKVPETAVPIPIAPPRFILKSLYILISPANAPKFP